jgi:O-methyltransferase
MSLGFRFVSDHFDPINHLVDPSAKDYRAQATSPDEMLCIANHLYVLQTRGVLETLIECGCFKGFSTCCLSQACAWLGVKMHVFDSFEGLPSSASDYYSEGDFRAPIDEVLDNVRTFGQLAAVELHQGFFSQTLPYFTEPVGCIWMDVDLKSSAQDVMALLPRLPVESCVFSHELPSEAFVGGKPQPTVSEVLPPLVDAFTADGREPMGQHLVGLVGSIRSAQDGIPALDHGDISTIVAAAEE